MKLRSRPRRRPCSKTVSATGVFVVVISVAGGVGGSRVVASRMSLKATISSRAWNWLSSVSFW